ncbi:Uncharacterised protein [Streptococcus pneumoniae]|nr:Uncharacterised protein [Streptococcus pneumoniae]
MNIIDKQISFYSGLVLEYYTVTSKILLEIDLTFPDFILFYCKYLKKLNVYQRPQVIWLTFAFLYVYCIGKRLLLESVIVKCFIKCNV